MSGLFIPSGQERFFEPNEVIVSKTDMAGRITYVNRVFMKISGFTEPELLGRPHALIRHPSMPRSVFKLLWDSVEARREIFAYVINQCKNGDYYWVLAHVTPSFGPDGAVNGYHSNRRVPQRPAIEQTIIPLYTALLREEQQHRNSKEGMGHSSALLHKTLADKGVSYDEFIFSLAS